MKSCNKLFLFSIVMMLGVKLVHSQDPRFSQYFASPMTLNPALIGKGVNDWRASINYRNQWFGNATAFPFVTSTVSLEKRISTEKTGNNQLAIGTVFLTDKSNGGLLKNNFISFGVAYNNALDLEGNQLLGGGISISYRNRILDPSKFIFQSQFTSGGYQPGFGTPDGVNIDRNSYIDLNAGLSYSERRKTMGFNVGISYYNAAKPRDGAYLNDEHLLNSRISIQGGLQFYLKGDDELDFSLNTNHQGNGMDVRDMVMLGAIYKIGFGDKDKGLNRINFGGWTRFSESAVAYIGLESTKNWLFGISYDFTLNSLTSVYSNMQTMEASFVWQFSGKKQNNKRGLKNYDTIIY
jgi:type IX secretion system PorP/SprF family membrane protein